MAYVFLILWSQVYQLQSRIHRFNKQNIPSPTSPPKQAKISQKLKNYSLPLKISYITTILRLLSTIRYWKVVERDEQIYSTSSQVHSCRPKEKSVLTCWDGSFLLQSTCWIRVVPVFSYSSKGKAEARRQFWPKRRFLKGRHRLVCNSSDNRRGSLSERRLLRGGTRELRQCGPVFWRTSAPQTIQISIFPVPPLKLAINCHRFHETQTCRARSSTPGELIYHEVIRLFFLSVV